MISRLTDRDKLLRLVTERQLQRQVEGILTAYGWRWFHAPDNRPANGRVQKIRPGFPDLLAVRGPRLVVIELKTETGRIASEQVEWMQNFEAAGAEAYVWRPRDTETARRALA
ncbi:VRR-NUC domain-containing protein [Arthrobacter burdickii]|uniref:VRR-NUC domain-containing protein n=1 Tax=Arthrobacter burdickii TaxID=3035920 RepID=A0ABT8K4G5_9MICC|nr:VRR-NUC domain-containing protein [Arthrobacter burdickii]MDN4611932.1 VRR-NUC domain-containing protein [Arthrobacter burdickii]